MNQQSVLGLIPARGGSKGVPRKNIRLLDGRPLLAHTVEAALRAHSIDRIVISTDDDEIARVARRAGAEVPFLRPAAYATDTASSLSVVHHALSWLSLNQGYRPDAVALLSPTCPLRTAEQIDATVSLLWSSRVDSAVTICAVRDHPYFIYERTEGGRLRDLLDISDRPLRRQDMPAYFAPSQAVMVSRTSYLKIVGDPQPVFNSASMVGYEIDPISALDIDTPTDLVVAAGLLRERAVAPHVEPIGVESIGLDPVGLHPAPTLQPNGEIYQ